MLSCPTLALTWPGRLPGTQQVLSKYLSGWGTLGRPTGPLTSHRTGVPRSSASLRSSYDLPTSFLATSRHGHKHQLHCWYRVSGFWFGFKDIKEKRFWFSNIENTHLEKAVLAIQLQVAFRIKMPRSLDNQQSKSLWNWEDKTCDACMVLTTWVFV